MNPARATAEEYVQFLIGSPSAVSATEAARAQPDRPAAPAHDALTRLLHRLEPAPQAPWDEVRPSIAPSAGVPVVDDSTLDKPRAKHLGLVGHRRSGNHHRAVQGINRITPLRTDGDRLYPCDYRIYHKAGDGKTKNDHFADVLTAAHGRGLTPSCVLFDGGYAGVENLKRVRHFGWRFGTRLKSNREARIARGGATAVAEQPIAASGAVGWLPGDGEGRVFRVAAPDGDTTHWATNDLGLDEAARLTAAELSWSIEEAPRGVKPFTGVARCQVRYSRGQRNHIGLALRAFVRPEYHRFTTAVSWFAATAAIVRDAARHYLAEPRYRLPNPATA